MSRGPDDGLDGVPRLGAMLGRYRLDAVLGRGGMGVVFRAVDERLDRTVAIKVLAPDLAGDPLTQERFLREARLASSIEHPHIVPVLEAASVGGVDYIAMRFVPGSDLGRVLRREAPLSATRTVAIIEQVADALDAAHARGLIHRDVKPSNVLLEERAGSGEEWAWLSDFGLTKRMDGSIQPTREGLVGTLEYIAPEAIKHGTVDGRSDQYALGCVAYHCLSGKPPFVAQSEAQLLHAHLHDTPPPVAGHDAPPGRIDEVIRRALAKAPAERFPSCVAFATELRRAIEATPTAGAVALAAGSGAVNKSPGDSTRAVRPGGLAPVVSGRRRQLVGTLILAGAVGGSLYLVAQPRQSPDDLAVLPSSSTSGPRATTTATSDLAGLAGTARLTPAVVATATPGASLDTSATPPSGATPSATSLTGPDGVIVFAGERDGNYDIWAVRPDGKGQRRLTKAAVRERSPDVSPDGSSIVFAAGPDGHRDLIRINADGTGRERLTTWDGDDYAPAISPDGRRLAYVSDRSGNLDIWIMSDEGNGFDEATAVNMTDHSGTDGDHFDQLPAWFADGRRLVFNSNRAESADIWELDTEDEGAPIQLTQDRAGEFQATINSDDAIVFVRRRTQDLNRELYVLRPGGEPRRLTSTSAHEVWPDFAPDGVRLVTTRGGVRPDLTEFNTTLVILNIDGDDLGSLVLDPENAVDPAWVPQLGPIEP